ncbi:MAG: glycosyltransferase family 39 protein [Victivallaceae bacterium]|jgi:4-amino-4-deoxy-L-arabinose transferase-like glycosyltransferase
MVEKRVLSDFIREKKAEIVFWAFAAVMLLAGLGTAGLWASEDRWAEITREMLLSKDFLHPAINGEVYFDKPLLSYWLIALAAMVLRHLDEFAIRLPGAISALFGLYGTIYLGRKLWSKEAGMAAGWILLSCYGFLFWGRTAAADMENLTAVILAVAWFFARVDKPGFFSYLIFYLICFLGAMTKGLPALGIPLIAILPYLLTDKRWKDHFRFSNFAALAAGLLIFLIPLQLAKYLPMPEYYSLPAEKLTGLELVWRENIIRFFKPFDHDDEPFFCYVYQLPRVLLPWSLVFAAALAAALSCWKKLKPETKWLLQAIALIFCCFSISGSRRWYYILPLMPFCAILTALFLCSDWQVQWRKRVILLMKWIIMAAAVLDILCIAALPFSGSIPPMKFLIAAPLLGIAALAVFWGEKRCPESISRLTGVPAQAAGMLMAGAIIVGGFFAFQLPSLDQYRTEKPFALELKTKMSGISPENIGFFQKVPPKVVYYTELKRPGRMIADAEELKQFLAAGKGPKLLVGYSRDKDLEPLRECLPPAIIDNPVLKEKYAPRENKNSKKLCAWIINR